MKSRVVSAEKRLRKVFESRKYFALGFIILTFLFMIILIKTVNSVSFSVLISHKLLIVSAIVVSFIFVLLKSVITRISLSSQNIRLSLISCIKFFTLSIFVEIVLFPSKLAGDLFRYVYLKRYNQGRRVKAVLFFRLVTMLAFSIIFIIFASWNFTLITLVSLVIIAFLYRFIKKIVEKFIFKGRKSLNFRFLWDDKKKLFAALSLTFCCILLEILRAALILMVFDVTPRYDFAIMYLVAYTLGVLSNIPFGLGVKDFSFGIYLSAFMSPGEVILYMLVLRLTGELLTGLVGWFIFMFDFRKKLKKG